MRAGCAFGRAGLGGTDVHAAIHQRRIEADDFHRQMRSDFKRQAGFAAGGGAEQGEGFGWVHKSFRRPKLITRQISNLVKQPRLRLLALVFKSFDFIGMLQGEADFIKAV